MKLFFAFGAIFAVSVAERRTHTAFTRPITLAQGGVSNDFHTLPIPKGPIAVYRFAADIVEIAADGTVIPTPNYDAYLHHHVVGSNHASHKDKQNQWSPMKPQNMYRGVGFGAGTESRGTPQEFNAPFAFITSEGEDEWVANVHVINTRKMTPSNAHHCLECPCTSSDVTANGTVNGYEMGLRCNAQLTHEKNTACFADTYTGGLRCCNDKEFCLEDKDLDPSIGESTFYMRYSFDYDDVKPESRPLHLAACCDASGSLDHFGAVEYDIPKCDPTINPGCTHTLSTRQHIGTANGAFGFGTNFNMHDDKEIDVVYIVGHQHRSGLGISIYDDKTDALLCDSVPAYGTGTVAGNEAGYIVSMSHCTFDPPRRMRSSDIVRVVSTYNSTDAHTGVMSLLYIAVADASTAAPAKLDAAPAATGFVTGWTALGGLAVVGAVVAIIYRKKTRAGYAKVAEPTTMN